MREISNTGTVPNAECLNFSTDIQEQFRTKEFHIVDFRDDDGEVRSYPLPVCWTWIDEFGNIFAYWPKEDKASKITACMRIERGLTPTKDCVLYPVVQMPRKRFKTHVEVIFE